jgi:hypothetical protein
LFKDSPITTMKNTTMKPTTANRPKKARKPACKGVQKHKRHTVTLQIPYGMTATHLDNAFRTAWGLTTKGALNSIIWNMLDELASSHKPLVPEGFISTHDVIASN